MNRATVFLYVFLPLYLFVVVPLTVLWVWRRKRQKMERSLADASYPTLAEIRAAMPPEELRAHRRNLAALILLPIVVAAIYTLYRLFMLNLQPFMVGRGMLPALEFAFFLFLFYYVLCLPVGFVALYIVPARRDALRPGHDLVRLGPHPYSRDSGEHREGPAGMILLGLGFLAAGWLNAGHRFGIDALFGILLVVLGVIGLSVPKRITERWSSRMAEARSSRITENGILAAGFFCPWSKIRWYRWTRDGSVLLFGIRQWMKLLPIRHVYVPEEHRENVGKILEAALPGKAYDAMKS